MEPAWGASWTWGLSLIALTIAAHALVVVTLARGLRRARRRRPCCILSNSITTRGISGLKLEPEWQMMGVGSRRMLLFGISTAFVFAVIQQIEQVISQVEDYDL